MNLMRKNWDGCSTKYVVWEHGARETDSRAADYGGEELFGWVCGHDEGIARWPQAGGTEGSDAAGGKKARAGLRVRMKVAENLYQVFEIPLQLPKDEPLWKKKRMGPKRWNGV